MVIRDNSGYQGIDVNAMGFAGTIFVKTIDDFEKVSQLTPLKIINSL